MRRRTGPRFRRRRHSSRSCRRRRPAAFSRIVQPGESASPAACARRARTTWTIALATPMPVSIVIPWSVDLAAQIAGDYARVVNKVPRLAAQYDRAGFEHIATVGGFKRGTSVLLDQQDRHAK